MKYKEDAIKQEIVYDGKIIKVRKDIAKTTDDKEVFREVVEHPGGVGIALEDEEGRFFLVRQYRYGQSMEMLEFPAGKKEIGEDPLETAKREIEEETGYKGEDFIELGEIVPTPAYDTEVINLYYAKQGEKVGQNFDEDEYIELEKKTLDEIIDLILNGEITDAKTVAMAFLIKEKVKRL